jgi:hypothetical protein
MSWLDFWWLFWGLLLLPLDSGLIYPTAAEKDFGGKSDIKSIHGIPITPRVRHMALGTDSYVQ